MYNKLKVKGLKYLHYLQVLLQTTRQTIPHNSKLTGTHILRCFFILHLVTMATVTMTKTVLTMTMSQKIVFLGIFVRNQCPIKLKAREDIGADSLSFPLTPLMAMSTLFNTQNLSLVLIWFITSAYDSFCFSASKEAILL